MLNMLCRLNLQQQEETCREKICIKLKKIFFSVIVMLYQYHYHHEEKHVATSILFFVFFNLLCMEECAGISIISGESDD